MNNPQNKNIKHILLGFKCYVYSILARSQDRFYFILASDIKEDNLEESSVLCHIHEVAPGYSVTKEVWVGGIDYGMHGWLVSTGVIVVLTHAVGLKKKNIGTKVTFCQISRFNYLSA